MSPLPQVCRSAAIQNIMVEKVQLQIAVPENDVLEALQAYYAGQLELPDDAQVDPVEDCNDPDDKTVVTVQWYGEPVPGEYARLKAKEKENEEEEEDEDEGECDDEYDSFDVLSCLACGRRLRQRHTQTCPRRSPKRQVVVTGNCTRSRRQSHRRGP